MNSLLCWGVCEAAVGLGLLSPMGVWAPPSGVHPMAEPMPTRAASSAPSSGNSNLVCGLRPGMPQGRPVKV